MEKESSISTNNVNLIIIFYLFFIIGLVNGKQNLFRYRKEDHVKLGINLLSEITMTLNETIGDNKILYCSFKELPDEVFLNNIKIGEKICSVYLSNKNNNTIKIKWKNNLKSCRFMFLSMSNIVEIDLSNFDTSSVTDMSYMFYYCFSLSSLNVSNFDTSLVTDMSYMFFFCSSLEFLDVSNFNTSLVTNMQSMFEECRKLDFLNLSNFNTSLVTNMERMFDFCLLLSSLDISNFNTSLVKNMYGMFSVNKLKSLDLSKFQTTSVKNMGWMFHNCISLKYLDLSNFDTSSVTNMGLMFSDSFFLEFINISNFNTSSVTNMQSMFEACNSLISLNLSNFNTSLVINMGRMFYRCYSLISLNLSNFNTSLVTNMGRMFSYCELLKSIDVSNFNTSLVKDMSRMFESCNSLELLDLSNFNTSLVTNMTYMFSGCRNLIYLNLQNFRENPNLMISSILYNIRENIIYCIKEESSPEIHKLFTDKLCSKKDCSSNWREKNEILIKYSCISNCHKNLYIFQYNNECYEKCPLGTHPINYICSENSLSTFSTEVSTNIKANIDTNINTDINNNVIISTDINDNIYTNLTTYFDTIINTYFITDTESDIGTNIYTNTQTDGDISINTDINTNNINTHIITDTESDIRSNIYTNTQTDRDININTDINTIINIDDNADNNSYLSLCNISIINIYDTKIDNETIKKYVNNYYVNKSTNKNVIYYFNKKANLRITIFKDWLCTDDLLKNGFFKLNTSKINNKIKDLNNFEYFMYIYINYNYNNYFEIYDTKDRKKIINLENIIDLNENNLIITNNFTEEINNHFSKVILNKINEFNIDIFDKDFYIYSDLCKNFTIQNIDIPLKERRQILFLGNIQKEITCNNINCDIESISMKKFIGECNCKIETLFNNLITKNEQYKSFINKEHIKYINSKSKINSLLNLKCGKESFKLANLKNNIIFYISIIFISVYILIFFVYYICSKNNKYKIYKKIKLNPPKIQKFDISDDFEDNEEEEQNKEKNKENIKENKNENQIIVQVENKDKEIENGEKKSIDFLILNMPQKKYKHSIKNNKRNNKLPPINNTNSKNDAKIEKEKVIKFKKNIKNKNVFDDLNQNTEDNYLNKNSNKKEIVNNKISDLKSFFILDTNENFSYYYWKLLSLKQPIINLFTSIDFLKTGKSYIPLPIKIIRILFYLLINIFFNSLHLEQQYFRKKFYYFESKYNIINTYPEKIISLNERLIYAFTHSITSGIICFIICFVIQSLLNYFFFNSKNDIIKIKNNSSNNDREILKLLNEYYKTYFLIVFSIKFIVLLFICYSIINFTQIYTGGITDLIAGTIWTFIFLQVFPFIYCIIFSFFFKLKNKNKNNYLLNFGEFIYF